MRGTVKIFLVLLFVLGAGFYCKKEPLNDTSLENYVKVYGVLAAKGPELKRHLGGAADGSGCSECTPILEAAATGGGFEDYDAFLKADERIREAVNYIQLTETFGKAKEGMGKMTDEQTCMQMMGAQGDLTEEQKKEKCQTMATGVGAAQGAMDAVGGVMKFFVDEEDVEAVRPHVKNIDRAINNKGLPCQFDFTCPEKNLNLEQVQG